MDISKEPMIVNLSIANAGCKDVEVEVSDPQRTIRKQIESIIKVFELPTSDNSGRPIDYFLCKMVMDDEEEEFIIMYFEDEDGNEMTLLDYDIKSGDHIALLQPVLYGSAIVWPIPLNNPSSSPEKNNDE